MVLTFYLFIKVLVVIVKNVSQVLPNITLNIAGDNPFLFKEFRQFSRFRPALLLAPLHMMQQGRMRIRAQTANIMLCLEF